MLSKLGIDSLLAGEVANANHSFYQTLTDPCEGNSEYDHTCLIGTELQTENIHDKPVSTPGNLLRLDLS